MSFETTAAVGAGLKIFGLPLGAGVAATVLGFMIMWPKTLHEGAMRLACAITSSFVLGPVFVIAMWGWKPELFHAAESFARVCGYPPVVGLLVVSAPMLVMAALPAWWLLGAIVLWLERRRGKDIGELAHDAAEIVRDVRSTI